MLAVGSVMGGAGILLAGLLSLLFRRPEAPRWARAEVTAFLSVVPFAAAIAVGLGLTLGGLYQLSQGGGDLRELAVLVAVPVVVALLWYALGINRRLRGYAVAMPANVVAMADVRLAGTVDQPPDAPAPGTPSRRPNRRAA
jgi:hypothetical protein